MRSIDYWIDCGELGELLIDVEYDYQPRERATYDDPGCGAEVTVTRVSHKSTGQDISYLFVDALQNSDDLIQKIIDSEEIDRRADAADHYYDQMKERKLYESA